MSQAWEAYKKAHNPIKEAIAKLTPTQYAALICQNRIVLTEGGNQCLAGDQEVNGTPISEIGPENTVLSWDGTRIVDAHPKRAFVKGEEPLYSFKLSSGRSFRASLGHTVLTSVGWLTLRTIFYLGSRGLRVPIVDAGPSAQKPGAQHSTQKAEGSRSDYRPVRHSCGERPPSWSDISQCSSQALADVLGHTEQASLSLGDRANIWQHTHLLSLFYHPSSLDAQPLTWDPSDETLCQTYRTPWKQAFQTLRGELLSQSGLYPLPLPTGEDPQRATDSNDLLSSPFITSFLYLDSITSLGVGQVWDMEVPVYGNYLCEGAIHHNSGKSYWAAVCTACDVMDCHPVDKFGCPIDSWYCTTSYDLFAQQAFGHLQDLLLYPGESIHKLPTVNIRKIDWVVSGSQPKKIWLNNESTITVKTYEQGRGEFQSKTLARAIVDEECPDIIWEELRARTFSTGNVDPRLRVAATPVLGAPWLDNLREDSIMGKSWVKAFTLNTLDNPSVNRAVIEEMIEQYKDQPHLLDLRLKGVPYHAQGLVYPDGQFKREHVCEPFEIPSDWAKFRCIDHGWRNCACVWLAISPKEDTIVMYRDYIGRERTIGQNAAAIMAHESKDGFYADSLIDKATVAKDAETGVPVINLWRAKGLWVRPAPDNRVISGIERCKDLLTEMGGPNLDRPRFMVFNTCQEFLKERRAYRWSPERPKGDERKDKPEKRGDHLCDAWRYLIASSLKWVNMAYKRPPPSKEKDPVAYYFWQARHKQDDGDTL